MQSDGLNSALSPLVYGDIALSINTHYNTINTINNKRIMCKHATFDNFCNRFVNIS